MTENVNIKESVKKLLFEQHKSTVSSFDRIVLRWFV